METWECCRRRQWQKTQSEGDRLVGQVELLGEILPHCHVSTLGALYCTSRLMQSHLRQDYFWQAMCARYDYRPISTVLPRRIGNIRMDDSRMDDSRIGNIRMDVDGIDYQRTFRENYQTERNWQRGRFRSWLVIHREVGEEGRSSSVYLCLSPSKAISVSPPSSGRVWDMASGRHLAYLDGHVGAIAAVECGADIVVSGGADSVIKVWDARTGRCLQTLCGHQGEVSCLQLCGQDARLVSGSEDGTVRVWDLRTGGCEQVLAGQGAVGCLQISDRRLISGSGDGTIAVWDLSTGEIVRQVACGGGSVYCLQCDGRRLAAGFEDGTVRVWTGPFLQQPPTVLGGHSGPVVCLRLFRDRLVTGSADHTIRVWDLGRMSEQFVIRDHTGPVWSLHVDETRIVSSSFDSRLLVRYFGPTRY